MLAKEESEEELYPLSQQYEFFLTDSPPVTPRKRVNLEEDPCFESVS